MFTILCSISVRAQSSPDGAGPEELIERLQKRIDQLEASQKVMQEKIDHYGCRWPAAQPPEAAATPPPETVETQPEAPLAHVLGPDNFTASATSTMAGPLRNCLLAD